MIVCPVKCTYEYLAIPWWFHFTAQSITLTQNKQSLITQKRNCTVIRPTYQTVDVVSLFRYFNIAHSVTALNGKHTLSGG